MDNVVRHLYLSIAQQRLFYVENHRCEASYVVSTAQNGPGEKEGSYCTPRGWHEIADILGLDQPIHTVFKARQPTGQIYTSSLEAEFPQQDWILTRIIRIKGQEQGFNLGGDVDTYQRYIYIHGCAAENLLGQPLSHGCIRMANDEIVQLAKRLTKGDTLFIY